MKQWKKSSLGAGAPALWVSLALVACGGERGAVGEARDTRHLGDESSAGDGGAGRGSGETPSPSTNSPPSSDSAPSTQGPDTGTPGPGRHEYDLEPELTLEGSPVDSNYVRLTHRQWANSVTANLRLVEAVTEADSFPPDPWARYSNDEAVLSMRQELLPAYQEAAANIARRVAHDPESLDRVSATRSPEQFIDEVGRRFYRRPVSSTEREAFLSLFDTGAALAAPGEETFAAGVQMLLEVWMQAPNFLYRVEHSQGLLDGFEMATRLAYALTDSTPSDALLDAAEAGELDTAEGVARAAAALLETPLAAATFQRFHDETFALQRLKAFALRELDDGATLEGKQLTEASHHYFDRVLLDDWGFRQLLLAPVAYADPALARLYGSPPPSTNTFESFNLPPSRVGFFAQVPFLAADSINNTPNLFRRGATFLNYVLCQHLEVPPDLPVPLPVPPEAGLTNREQSSRLVADPACQTCHRFMDPFGFAFENFDGLGRERSVDNGKPVDTTGAYPYSSSLTFANSTELLAILAESPLAHACYSARLSEFALSRSLGPADSELVSELKRSSLEDDEPLAKLVIRLVSSEAFRSAGVSP